MHIAQNTFITAALFYCISFFYYSFKGERDLIFFSLLFTGVLLNFSSILVRYYYSWPLLPMYNSPYFVPFFLGILFKYSKKESIRTDYLFLLVLSLLSVLAVFFPKDYYYPFFKSNTVFSHFFFIFGVIGKAFFIMASVYALSYLKNRQIESLNSVRSNIIAGYVLWTISLFSGEIWSYLGWGTPVVWDDVSFTTVMAVWFYYACYLHLHLLKSFTRERIAAFALIGLPVLIFITFYTEMGKFCFPVL